MKPVPKPATKQAQRKQQGRQQQQPEKQFFKSQVLLAVSTTVFSGLLLITPTSQTPALRELP